MTRLPVLRGLAALALVTLAFGCSKSEQSSTTTDSTLSATPEPAPAPANDTAAAQSTMPQKPATPPAHVLVQHILIGFQGSVPQKQIARTKEDAEKLAKEVLERARKGENFDALVQQYTDDQFPGVYGLANNGVTPDVAKQEYARDGMVAGFGDVAFELSPGNVGMADYDAKKSPFGWHIIKRLE
jgi:hypothetical protein